MLIELDYVTISALESALIVAEAAEERHAKEWSKMAGSMGAPEQSRAAGELAAFSRRQADRFRKTMDALQKAQKEAPVSGGQTSGAKGK